MSSTNRADAEELQIAETIISQSTTSAQETQSANRQAEKAASSEHENTNKAKDNQHGNIFQSKLLMLYFLRSINMGWEFSLGTELPDEGGKFDDLIFRYRASSSSSWSYQYLQAKHKLDGSRTKKITKNDLSQTSDQDFSLPKYFRSYLQIRRRHDNKSKEKIDSCVICTNINIDNKDDFEKKEINGTEDVQKILSFNKPDCNTNTTEEVSPTCYKIRSGTIFEKELIKLFENNSISHVLVEKLRPQPPKSTPKTLDPGDEKLRNYHIALVEEKVIYLKAAKFHEEFIKDDSELSPGAKELRRILVGPPGTSQDNSWKSWTFNIKDGFGETKISPKEFNYELPTAATEVEIQEFMKKFFLAVNTPNEGELTGILEEELKNYYNMNSVDSICGSIFTKMTDWFRNPQNKWLSNKKGMEIFLDKTELELKSLFPIIWSNRYQNYLNRVFNIEVQTEMVTELDSFLTRHDDAQSSSKEIEIKTPSPKLTAIKVIAALYSMEKYKRKGSFLAISSSLLKEDWVSEVFLEVSNAQGLLIVIVIANNAEEKILSNIINSIIKNRIVIRKEYSGQKALQQTAKLDEITYEQLSSESKKKLLEAKVSFQENVITMENLIGEEVLKQIDGSVFPLILEEFEEVITEEKKIIISNPSLEPVVSYIKREFTTNGLDIRNESDLINDTKKMVIILGLPGSGKSTTLSHFYQELKVQTTDRKPKIWMIHIDLATHNEELKKYNEELKKSIKELEKSTEKLKKSNEELKKCYEELEQTNEESKKCYEELEKSNEELKKSNEELEKLNEKLREDSDFISFLFYNLVPDDIKDSPFKRWLFFKYGMKSDSGIAVHFMFDNLDKIEDEARKTAIDLLKDLNQHEKVGRVFVTAQLENFKDLNNEQGKKLDYSAYELKGLTKNQQQNVFKVHDSKWFDKNYVKEILDEPSFEKFFEIPLHCNILADWARSQQKDESLVGFYQYFKKFKENMAVKLPNDDRSAENHYLTLAFKTIFNEEMEKNNDLKNCIENSFIFDTIHVNANQEEREYYEKKAIEAGLHFGLTYRGRKGTDQFLHNSLAEYFVAEYLYKGFHLEDSLQYTLLQQKAIRNFIVQNVLVGDGCKTVRRFLNLQLRNVVWNEKWRDIIEKGQNLKVKKITEKDKTAIERLKMFVQGFNWEGQNAKEIIPEYLALCTAIEEKNDNIFVLLLDCIEIMHYREATQSTDHKMKMLATFQYSKDTHSVGTVPTYCDLDKAIDSIVRNVLSRRTSSSTDEEFGEEPGDFGQTKKVDESFLSFISEQWKDDVISKAEKDNILFCSKLSENRLNMFFNFKKNATNS